MNKVALGLTLALAAMGCGRSQKSVAAAPDTAAPDTALPSRSGDHDVAAAGDISSEAMSQLKTFRDQACACKDAACAEQAEKSFDDWGEANIEEIKKATPSESFEKEFRKIQREARDCQEKLVSAAGDIASEAMSQLKTFRDKACACKDVACAEQAEKSFDDWGEANIDELKKATPSESFEKEFRKIQREARDCQEKLEEAARP